MHDPPAPNGRRFRLTYTQYTEAPLDLASFTAHAPDAQRSVCAWGEARSSRMGSGPRPRHCVIATPLEVPIRVAPFAIMRSAVVQSRTPPDAFTPIESPTTRRISATASALAPPA